MMFENIFQVPILLVSKQELERMADDSLVVSEKKKYERVWGTFPTYGALSPGEDLAPFYLKTMRGKLKRGERLIDFGCGAGRAAKSFLFAGLSVELVDFCANCLDPGIALLTQIMSDRCRFWEGCLWDLPHDLPVAEWGICCDVMEHIPPEKVDLVLASISSRILKGAVFSIFLKEDEFGPAIGERLHLTLESKEWWQQALERHFPKVKKLMGTDDWVIFQTMK